MRSFYSWFFSVPIGRARVAIVVADSFAGFVAVFSGPFVIPVLMSYFFKYSFLFWVLSSVAFALGSPLFAWQIVIVTPARVVIVRTMFLVPYWVTRVPPGISAELYEAWEDTAPSGIAYDVRKGYAHIGNGWNARSLLILVQQCEVRVRSNTSLERTRER